MVVSVEISGVLERRLRRLVDLGLYGSVSEIVRDALRKYFESIDMRRIALDLYMSREISLAYAAELAGLSYEELLDYMLYKGIHPLLGVLDISEIEEIHGELLLDFSSTHVIYKSRLADLLTGDTLAKLGLDILAPKQLMPRIQALNAVRIRLGLQPFNPKRYIELDVDEREDTGVIAPLERACIDYVLDNNAILLSDDLRVRVIAKRSGATAHSSLALFDLLLRTSWVKLNEEEITQTILSLKAVPVLIPVALEERWLARK